MISILCLVLLVSPALAAQRRVDDAALRTAREETEIILDLGRLLGFVHRMTQESPELDFESDQAREMLEILEEIRGTPRMTPTRARTMIQRIEDTILTAAQLAYTDRLWINAQRNDQRNTQNSRAESASSGQESASASRAGPGSSSRQGTSTEDGAPAGSLASYAAGGPYNPMTETGRRHAEDFEALYAYLQTKRVGR
ncbi:hypothetical protein [Alkalispirochaeta americana]|uniref:hypothetical protein n=1 Tax=Alkalispirochaeta americana TaxID=159291 RepID=UPI000970490E|nr:hypothetical protein [Alkalispirochaeta americana]